MLLMVRKDVYMYSDAARIKMLTVITKLYFLLLPRQDSQERQKQEKEQAQREKEQAQREKEQESAPSGAGVKFCGLNKSDIPAGAVGEVRRVLTSKTLYQVRRQDEVLWGCWSHCC